MVAYMTGRCRRGHALLAVLICAFLLALPSLWNRTAFVYFDSGVYLSHGDKAVQMVLSKLGLGTGAEHAALADEAAPPPQEAGGLGDGSDDNVIAGRSVYYSLFAWTGLTVLGLGGVVAMQALVLSALIVMCLRMVWPAAPPAQFLIATSLMALTLSLLSSAGLFAALIMPDAWTGMLIIAFALLLASEGPLPLGTRLMLGGVMTLAALFHTSHILLLASMVGLLGLAMLHAGWRRVVPPARLLLPSLALVCGVAGHLAFSAATAAVTGQKPLTMPFVTAHLVDLGPGTRLAQQSCPESGFAICPYADRLPIDWISFLFEADPLTGVFAAVPPEVQRAISEEQARFAIATLKAEPLATAGGLLRDGISQLWHLGVEDMPLTRENDAFLTQFFTPDVAEAVRASSIYDRPELRAVFTQIIQVGTGLSVLALLALALAGRLPQRGPLAMLLLVCGVGLVLNALVCGVFASPYGRFQARVAWMLPFLLLMTLLVVFAASVKKEAVHDL